MAVDKKGITIKEYPKLIRVEGIKNKVLVNSVEEEAKYNKSPEAPKSKNPAGNWGK